MSHRWIVAAAALLFSVGIVTPSVAFADAQVHVQVRDHENEPVDGRVTLRPRAGGDASYSCQTTAGDCDIHDVPAGMYVVDFAPNEGPAPRPRNAVVAEGRVTLRVAGRPR